MRVPESAYQTLFEGHPDGMVLVELDTGRIVDCNARFCDLADRDPETVREARIATIAAATPDATDGIETQLRRERPGSETVEWRLRPDDASTLAVTARLSSVEVDGERHALVRVSAAPSTGRAGSGGGTVGERVPTGADRTDGGAEGRAGPAAPARERTAAQAAASRCPGADRDPTARQLEVAHTLLETVPSGVLRTDPSPDGTFEYVNSALVSLLGAESADQLRGRRVADVYADPEERDALIDALRETDRDRVKHEVEFRTLDGERRDVAVTATLTGGETERIHKVVQDVTERKEREAELERHERLIENLPIGVYRNTPGPSGEFRFLNEAMVELFDADSKAELRDHAVEDLYADPAERAAFSEALRAEGAVTEREIELVTLDGREIWGSVTAIARETDEGVIFDGVIQDVTERKRYERRLGQQRDNLDLMNQMLRHDIRNDLQLVTAYADVLDDHVDEAGTEHLHTIQESATHAVELTETARDLADVMRSSDDATKPVPLRTPLHAEIDEIRAEYPNAAITVEGSIPECPVVANEMLDSVFRNLLGNTVQHNDAPVPEVTVAATESEETVAVRIADNGPGVPDSQKDEIFGKGEKGLDSHGTGIGLYLVEQLVDAYGGSVSVEDNDPGGAVFVVELVKAP